MKNIEIFLRKLLLKIYLLFQKQSTSNELPEWSDKSKILFIRLNRIGDALVCTPLIYAINEKYKCQISILAHKNNGFIFDHINSVDNIWLLKKGFKGISYIINKINKEKFDAIIDLHDDVSTTTSIIIGQSKAKYKFSLDKENRKLFTHTVNKLDPRTHHVVDRVMTLGQLFNIHKTPSGNNIKYFPSNSSDNAVNDFLERNKLSGDKLLFGINISAGSDARFWGVERFQKLLKFISHYDLQVLIISSPADKIVAEQIAQNEYICFSDQDFDIFAALIKKLDFLFTPDTSVIHLASAYEIPVFGLYVKYRTQDMIWSPYKSKFECVITEEPNLINLSFEEVIAKFKPFFEEYYEKRNTKLQKI